MKTCQLASIVVLLIICGHQTVQGQSKSKIIGIWYNTEKTARIEIMENENEMIGKLVWIRQNEGDPEVFLDVVNADTSLRNRPLMGLTILKGLKYNNGIWSEGEIYDPESGLSYTCELQLKKKDVLEVKGFLGDSWVSRTVEWNRVKK
nr:DUF2147 domain-containing protein [Algoriphagus locisalis]